jgi:hypothetical protein
LTQTQPSSREREGKVRDGKEHAPLIGHELQAQSSSRIDRILTGMIVAGAVVLGCGSTLYDLFGTHDVKNGLVKAVITTGLIASIRRSFQNQAVVDRIRSRIRGTKPPPHRHR